MLLCQVDVETTIHSPEDEVMGQNLVTPAAAVDVSSASINPSVPSKPSDPKFSKYEHPDGDDSEDDVPLARVILDHQRVNLKRPRLPSLSVLDEKAIRSKRRTASCCMKLFFFFDGWCHFT